MLPLHYFLLLKQTFCHKLLHPKNPKVIRLLLPGDWKTLSSRHRGLQLYGSRSHPIWLTQLSILEVQPLLLYLICTMKRSKIYMSCLTQFANDHGDDISFPSINFPHLDSHIPTAPAYGVYTSQLIRYTRACSLHWGFLKRHHILSTKLLNQGFLKNSFILSFKDYRKLKSILYVPYRS